MTFEKTDKEAGDGQFYKKDKVLIITFIGDESHCKVCFHIRLIETRESQSCGLWLELGDSQVLLLTGLVDVLAAVEADQVVVEVRLEPEGGEINGT